jgi:hypothetical protein
MAARRKRGGRVKVKSHSRTPRGSNAGKSRPKVKTHTRKKPDPSSYPRPRRKR